MNIIFNLRIINLNKLKQDAYTNTNKFYYIRLIINLKDTYI